MHKRQLLNECADLFIVCDDDTRIPCSRFHVSTRCQVLRWVAEDTGVRRDIPFPRIASRTLQLAVDVIHDIISLEDVATLEDMDAVVEGFDILGCDIDTAPRVWDLLTTIHDIRPRLPGLMRSSIPREDVLVRVVTMAPMIDDLIHTLRSCEPDIEMAIFLSTALAKMYPTFTLVKELTRMISGLTIDEAMRIAGGDGIGLYSHPREVGSILGYLRDAYRDPESETWKFVRSMYGAMHTYDDAPLSTSTFHGSVISFHDAQSISALMCLDGVVRRRVAVAKWLKVSLHGPACVVDVKAHAIDPTAKTCKCMDVRVLVETGGQRAEMIYSWCAPSWIPSMPVSTADCPVIYGDKTIFDAVVDSGKFSRKLLLRVDVFFGDASVIDDPPLF